MNFDEYIKNSLLRIIERGFKTNLPQFLLIGIINTIFGYSIIFFSMFILKLNYLISNSLGYFFGLILSFFLNKYFNFKTASKHLMEFSKFILAFITSFGLNSVVLYCSVEIFHIEKVVAIIIAGISYSICFFLISKFFVFRKTVSGTTENSHSSSSK